MAQTSIYNNIEKIDLKPYQLGNTKRNIYYIILDAMMAVETASRAGVVDENDTYERIKKTGLKYIDQSISSYNTTFLTLASIVQVDYHQTPSSPIHNDRALLFPRIIHHDGEFVPLISYLNKAQSSFLWTGSIWGPCVESDYWNCIGDEGISIAILLKFFHTTPLGGIYRIFFKRSLNDNYVLNKYYKHAQDNPILETPSFTFIHHMSPHGPHLFTETCKPVMNASDGYKGYKASYRCILLKIEKFMANINITGPDSIVVFQADRGWKVPEIGLSLEI